MKREIIRKSRTEDGGEKKTELAERVKESITEELHWTTLGEVTQIIAGNPAPQGKEFFEAGKYPFVRVQDMGRLGNKKTLYDTKDKINDKAVSKLRLFPKGSVLFTKSGASTLLNQRAILPREMYVVSHIAAAIPTSKVISEWLYYWLLTIDFAHYAHATTLPSLPLSKAKLIPIPVLPLSQQKSTIAEIEKQFTRLDAGVAALKRAQANLKRYRAAVLKAACEGRLVPTEADLARKEGRSYETGEQLLARILEERRKKRQGRGKYKEPVGVDTKKLPTLPEGWVWASLDQIGQEGRPILYGIIKPGPHIHDGIPYVR
ncbi:MAG: restriction endonuclease subunit S, partial [Taibaiella sp.]|nr:restriction endonuclease subunit S [Taibaiella sp.]